MQTSRTKLSRNLKRELEERLYRVVADIKSPEEAEVFLKDFLSKTELEIVCKRLAVAYYLDKKRSYQNIKDHLAVSSATVSVVASFLKSKKGYEVALQKIRADEWAEKWAQKISGLGKMMPFFSRR